MIGALNFNLSGSSSKASKSIMSSLDIVTGSTKSAIKLYFSRSFSMSVSSRGVSMAFIIPKDIKSPTIWVASMSIILLI